MLVYNLRDEQSAADVLQFPVDFYKRKLSFYILQHKQQKWQQQQWLAMKSDNNIYQLEVHIFHVKCYEIKNVFFFFFVFF